MYKKVISLLILLAALTAAGMTTSVMAEEASAAKVQKLIDAAKAAKKEAASVNGEWRDTGKMIKKAEELLKQGKFVEAAKLANDAAKQGHLGYQQAVSQKDLKMPSYLHYQ
ncbi:MAG: SoxXA-binding protein [Candidatus Thiodiazotropha sp.]